MTRVWLRHVGLAGEEGHGGAFECPEEAVPDWQAMGWEPGEAPEEHNPVIAENLAAQLAEAERLAAEQPGKSKTWTKTTTQES